MVDENKNQIERATQALNKALDLEEEQEIQIDPTGVDVTFESDFEIMDDGSAEKIQDQPVDMSQVPFDANLAEYIDETELGRLSSDLLAAFESDKDSRKDWESTYTKGLDMLGFTYENRTQPFEGASGVVHPLLAESVTQFQAQAYKELLPPSGPVRTVILGDPSPQTEQQAERVKDYMNYYVTHVMEEYDPEMDQLLFYLALSGSAFKKVYYDQILKRCVAKFVSSEDLYINYMATDIDQAERITHSIKMSENELKKLQLSGFYRDVKVTHGQVDTVSEVDGKVDELEGVSSPDLGQDIEHSVLEMHVDADIPGFEDTSGVKLPYIVTIDEFSTKILSIRRNYEQNDSSFKKIPYFVHFKFLPGLGFYGFGLIHMLGGLSRTATSVLRQLIDAGTLANLPAGYKARGMRIRDQEEPLQPGEFRDVDVTGTSIRESLMPLPFKEPSQTLFQLLGFAVDAGKSFSAIADMKMGEGNEQNPVGTTLALLERGTKVMSAIQKRLYYGQRKEFNLLARSIKLYTSPEYPYMVAGGNRMIKQADFDDRVDILPVADPNIFSMTQRITLAQQQLQLAQSNPQLHNIREAYRRMYTAMGVDNVDQLLKPDPSQPMPMSPAVENSLAMKGTQPKVFMQQNHQAHMKAHAEYMFTRMVQINPPLYAMLQAHMSEHLAMMVSQQVQQEFAEQDQQMQMMMQQAQTNPQMQQQVQMQMQQLKTQKDARQAELEAEATANLAKEEEARTKAEQQDPLIRLKQQEIDLRAAEIMSRKEDNQVKTVMDLQRLDLERDKAEADVTLNVLRESENVDKRKSNEALTEFKEQVNLTKEALQNDRPVPRGNEEDSESN
tara:strand:- start:2712 stop:5231 length:2520 start_codon:yes stop_codon:yes gene_type:complete